MSNFILIIIGRFLAFMNAAIRFINRRKSMQSTSELDKTGRVVSKVVPINVLHKSDDVIFALYNSLAHSFWRAQEFSLLNSHKAQLSAPIADFGCGDGSFASVLFQHIDYGIDIDEQALDTAKGYNIYENTIFISSDKKTISIDSNSIGSIFSNSVLEHAVNLEGTLSEIYRILKPGGLFIFTVPVKQFDKDLKRYFGEYEGERINLEFYHRNLMDVNEWESTLESIGFQLIKIVHYQPSWFTFLYYFSNVIPGLGRCISFFISQTWPLMRPCVLNIITRSIANTTHGGNVFVIVQKHSEKSNA